MYTLFLKIATRYLLKNKLYSFINIFGLAIGIASFVLIMLYVNYEYSYDKFEGSENVYRVYMDYTEDGVFVPGDAETYNSSGPTLREKFPEIKEFVRLSHLKEVTFMYNSNIVSGERGALADATYFDLFKYPLLKGNFHSVLQEPYTLLLSESLARKIFGNEDPMGKSLQVVFGGNTLFTVDGIMKDLPENTHMKNDFLISFATAMSWEAYPNDPKPNWNSNNLYTYIKLDKDSDASLLKKKINSLKIESLPYERHNIEPLEDIHLYSDKPFEAEANGSASRVRFLYAIALIIIFLSWLNYVNLSSAKSGERAKETGIRKVAGAQRPQIIIQSLLESLLLNLAAIIMACMILLIVVPIFNNFIHKELSIGFSDIGQFIPMLAFILLGALVSGVYPAVMLSNYAPATALKGKLNTSGRGLIIRKALITGQFFATIGLLVGTIVVSKQINFLQDQPIGAKLEQVLAVNGKVLTNEPDSLVRNGMTTLKGELRKIPFVKSTVLAQTYPGGGYDHLNSNVGITFPDGRRDDSRIWYNYSVGPEYFDMMDMKFVAGGPFLENSQGHSNSIVMNETFVRHMGISNMEDAVGKIVKFWNQDWVISGILEDYHHFGLKARIEPMIIRYDLNLRYMLIKMDADALSATGMNRAIAQIEGQWKDLFPLSTFNYTFLDQNYEAQYNEEKTFGSAFQIFTVLAIFIASLGLFGFTSYTVVQRKKEIGIRKVNGATIPQILSLLNKDFVKWVGMAFLIAIPISWYAMHKWLEGFAYKTTLSWWIFALAGIIALTIALLTVSWQSFKAAMANPVNSLRNE